jgi:alginate O-acetyltransferase complex protein AlgI
MVFSSLEFLLIFLPATLAATAVAMRLGERAVLWTLLVSSLVYYSWWNWKSLFVLIPLTAVTYVGGKRLAVAPSNAVAAFVIAVNLATLAYFKYSAFFADILRNFIAAVPAIPPQVLPLGISFFVFQKIAFTMDVRAGRARPADWPRFLLFVSFFPQLIAGPIVHWRELAPQLSRAVMARQANVALGLTLFVIGLSKKTLIADLLSPYVAAAFDGNPAALTAGQAWLAVTAYALQIYFDFSGYSDMAVGIALMLGIRLPWNFLSPYKADSIVEFWRRWHITLSNFLRDYLYIPLGGNRYGEPRRYVNIMITMLLGGLWHGAGWTFVAWGALHGIFITVEHAWNRLGWRMPRLSAHGLTLFGVLMAWVLFRAPNFESAVGMYTAMFTGFATPSAVAHSPDATTYFLIAAGSLIALFCPNAKQISERARLTPPLAIGIGLLGAAALLKQLYAGEISEFIYFRF